MKKRVANKVLKRLQPNGTAWHRALERDLPSLRTWLYRPATITRAKERRQLHSGGTVCLACASLWGLNRC